MFQAIKGLKLFVIFVLVVGFGVGTVWLLKTEPRICLSGPTYLFQEFNFSNLKGIELDHPTKINFGPDDRLYVSEENGLIKIYRVIKRRDHYEAALDETISSIKEIKNDK